MNTFYAVLDDEQKEAMNTLTVAQIETIFDISLIRFVVENGEIVALEV